MQNIRRATKKHRTLLIIVVAILMLGLVCSFAVWDSSKKGYTSNTGDDSATVPYAEQITYYEGQIAETAPANIADADYSTAYAVASLYMSVYEAANNAFYEKYIAALQVMTPTTDTDLPAENDTDTNTNANAEAEYEALMTEAQAYSTKAGEAVQKAILYYQAAIDVAPEDVSKEAIAQTYVKKGAAQLTVGEQAGAEESYSTALSLAPNNASIHCAYAVYLYNTAGSAAATAYLDERLVGLTEADPDYATYTNQKNTFAYYDSLYSGGEEDTTGGENAAGSTEDSAEAGN